MRAAPTGLAGDNPFALGCQAAALTHGHPSGYYSAGALAVIISEVVHGADSGEVIKDTWQLDEQNA